MTSAYFKSLLIYWIYEVIGHYAWGIAFPFNIWPVVGGFWRFVGVPGGGVLAVNSFRKSIQFRGFCIGQQTMVWREPKI